MCDLIVHLQSTTKEIHIHVRSICLRFWNVTNFVNWKCSSTKVQNRTRFSTDSFPFRSMTRRLVLSSNATWSFWASSTNDDRIKTNDRNQSRKFVVSHRQRTDITYACMNPCRRLYDIHDACSSAHCISRSVKPT